MKRSQEASCSNHEEQARDNRVPQESPNMWEKARHEDYFQLKYSLLYTIIQFQVYNILNEYINYTLLNIIIKCWLYFLCCSVYTCNLFYFIHSSFHGGFPSGAICVDKERNRIPTTHIQKSHFVCGSLDSLTSFSNSPYTYNTSLNIIQ